MHNIVQARERRFAVADEEQYKLYHLFQLGLGEHEVPPEQVLLVRVGGGGGAEVFDPMSRSSSMVWTMRLPMLASMIHLWATTRGKSFPVTNSLSSFVTPTPFPSALRLRLPMDYGHVSWL
jgi:hypothetical protein